MRRPTVADARAAAWTLRALRAARAQLRDGAVRHVRLPAPPGVPARAGRAVRVVLARVDGSCLERALVQQRWLAGQGIRRDVIVGTQGGTGGGFRAHAWLEGASGGVEGEYVEMTRLAP